MRLVVLFFLLHLFLSCNENLSKSDYPIKPVPFTDVNVTSGFWHERMETNRLVTIPYDFKKCEETGRISNFAKAGGLQDGEFEGIYFNDSDVLKVIEGAAYSLSLHPDPELEAYLDSVITLIAAAQEEDGYLYTNRTINPDKAADGAGAERWTNLRIYHELYNVGHMYEAAVAHYQATGKRSLLDVAIKNADLVADVFGPGRNMGVPGHEEIEIGLVKLYRVTGDQKYLDLARFFIDQRGNAEGHDLYGASAQDHLPVVEQSEAVGHAVRAGYLYAGMADVAALTGKQDYIDALGRIWDNIVTKKLYITGGVGAMRHGEGFGANYVLPNATAYNETCAAIAMMLMNHRLFLLHGHGKYMDVFERIMYNGFLSGISLEGNTFFYPNPLEFDGKYAFNQGQTGRSPWFDCSCCPVNIVRILPSLPGYVYAVRDNDFYVNLYMQNKSTIVLENQSVTIEQKTNYPWDGTIQVSIDPEKTGTFRIFLRIPGWLRNQPVPGDLYQYVQSNDSKATITINGQKYPLSVQNGYAEINRTWEAGDHISLKMPMAVRKVISHPKVEDNHKRVALERGPLVYCAEGIDNENQVLNLVLDKDASFSAEQKPDLLGGITVIKGKAGYSDDGARMQVRDFTAIPYYAWAHRGTGEMNVWFPYDRSVLQSSRPELSGRLRLKH